MYATKKDVGHEKLRHEMSSYIKYKTQKNSIMQGPLQNLINNWLVNK
jgi:hypothetical protein